MNHFVGHVSNSDMRGAGRAEPWTTGHLLHLVRQLSRLMPVILVGL